MKKFVFIIGFMNKFFLFLFILFISMPTSAQIERLCPVCKKVLSKCSYKGKHPKEAVCSTCKKAVSKCAYRGKHPKEVKPTIEKTIVVDGMTYKIKGNEATLIKGKIAESIMIPQYISDEGRRYPVVAIYGAFHEKGFDKDSLKIIKSVLIPEGIKSITSRAFQGCHSITSLYIPASVKEIKGEPFHDCYNLKKIIVDSKNKVFDSRNNCNAIIETKTGRLLKGCINTVIPQGIKCIGKSAFTECAIIKIVIPNSVDSIKSKAFFKCKSLVDVSLPPKLKYIGTFAFAWCFSLKKADLPNSVELHNGCFWRSGLEKVYIPKNVKIWSGRKDGEENPFEDCQYLSEIIVDKDNPNFDSRNKCNAIINRKTNVLMVGCKNSTIPDGVTKIGYSAFNGCKELVSISIPNSVREIGSYAFWECSNLNAINIPAYVESIEENAFNGCSKLSSVQFPDSMVSIGECAFYRCNSLKSVTLPSKLRTIGRNAFEKSGIETIRIPNGVEIPSGAIPTSSKIIRY